MITTTDSVGNNQPDGVDKRSTIYARNAPCTHPRGEDFIFAHIALAAYKLVTKTVSNTYRSIIACNSRTQISNRNLIY